MLGSTVKILLDKLSVIISTWFGVGFIPKAPGTFGTLAALPFVWLCLKMRGDSSSASFFNQMGLHDSISQSAIVILAVTALAIWAAARTEELWQCHDDSRIVVDEVAGIFATLYWFPFDTAYFVTGFLIFRLFDIWKPGPIGYIDEEVPGALGTVLDDVLAGLVSATLLYIIFHQKIVSIHENSVSFW